ncbi:MAG TPA: tetratricopeptide repeat protein [Methanothrix sp.]|nr:tetratricopeptide repeat protein [Methanothrix sp.]
MNGKNGLLAASGELLKSGAGTRSALALIALTALCSCTLAQEKTAEDWIERGGELFRNQSFEGAAEAYGTVIEAASLNKTLLAAAWKGKGRIFYDNGRYEAAIEAYDKAIEFAPSNVTPVLDLYAMNLSATAWHATGEALMALGRNYESEAAFSRAGELGYEK